MRLVTITIVCFAMLLAAIIAYAGNWTGYAVTLSNAPPTPTPTPTSTPIGNPSPTPTPTPTPGPTPGGLSVTINLGVSVGTGDPHFVGTESSGDQSSTSQLAALGLTEDLVNWTIDRGLLPTSLTYPNGDSVYEAALNVNCPGGTGPCVCPTGSVCDPNTWNWSTGFAGTFSIPEINKAKAARMSAPVEMLYGLHWEGNSCDTVNNNPFYPTDWRIFEDVVTKEVQHMVAATGGWPPYIQIGTEPDTGQCYTTFMNAAQYAVYYEHLAHAIRALNSTIPLGGPASVGGLANFQGYVDAMHADTNIPTSSVNFVSYHVYTANPLEDPTFVNYARQYWRGIKGKITEWNNVNGGDCSPAEDGDTSSIVGWFGSRLISIFALGDTSNYFTAAYPGSSNCTLWILNDGRVFIPKAWAIYLMSRQLGLGAGASSVKATMTNLTAAVGAVNSAGNPVAVMGQWFSGGAVTVVVNNIGNKTWNLQTFIADHGNNQAQSPVENINVPVTNSTLVHTFNMTDYSIAGILLHQIAPTPIPSPTPSGM